MTTPQQLASLTDLANLGLAAAAFPASITDGVKNGHLLAASGKVLGYVAKRAQLPLVSWGQDIVGATVAIATYTLMCLRGFDPANAADQVVIKGFDDTLKWLRDIARGDAELVDCVDSSAQTDEASPLLGSEPTLGWALPSSDDDEAS